MRFIHTLILALVLTCLGLGLFLYKAVVLDFPLFANKTVESWYIEAKLSFNPHGEAVKARMYLPMPSKHFAIVDENFISDAYGFSTKVDKKNGNRIAQWSKRHVKGKQVIFYRAILYDVQPSDKEVHEEKPKIKGIIYTDELFKQKAQEDPAYLALLNIIEQLHERSADEESFVNELVSLVNKHEDKRLDLIQQDIPEAKDINGLFKLVLESANIPSRLVHGVSLNESARELPVQTWVEYYQGSQWYRVASESENDGKKTALLLPWWQGEKDLAEMTGVRKQNVSVSVKRHTENALTEAIWRGRQVSEFIHSVSLFTLPIDVQLVFQVLLLVPLGALVMVILKQVIGIETFGTFMPVLVALAFRETQLLWGIFFFSMIVSIGMLCRAYFDRLHLLMAPRLSATLTIVVLVIFIISLVTFKFGISSGFSISLFPIVILTMVIERMTVMWDEAGLKYALKIATQSIVAAVIVYGVIYQPFMGHLFTTFPELLLVVMACALLLGRYNGYKLTEYYRFKSIGKY